jgi:hypothetical protein
MVEEAAIRSPKNLSNLLRSKRAKVKKRKLQSLTLISTADQITAKNHLNQAKKIKI